MVEMDLERPMEPADAALVELQSALGRYLSNRAASESPQHSPSEEISQAINTLATLLGIPSTDSLSYPSKIDVDPATDDEVDNAPQTAQTVQSQVSKRISSRWR